MAWTKAAVVRIERINELKFREIEDGGRSTIIKKGGVKSDSHDFVLDSVVNSTIQTLREKEQQGKGEKFRSEQTWPDVSIGHQGRGIW